MIILNGLILLLMNACNFDSSQDIHKNNKTELTVDKSIKIESLINQNGQTISTRILTPKGYHRVEVENNSKEFFFRKLNLKLDGSPVLLFNGNEKGNQNAHIAILTFDVGKADLQQCADAVMRLHAEYLFNQNKFDEIHFNYTNGFNASYSSWRKGKRIAVKGNSCSWVSTQKESNSYASFREYLNAVYNYAGSLSLSKELKSIPKLEDMEVGDVFIRGGSPGHAVTIMDIAKNEKGEKIFLLSQGYMPAQDIHVLKNPSNTSISPWYSVSEITQEIITPEYIFDKRELMRF